MSDPLDTADTTDAAPDELGSAVEPVGDTIELTDANADADAPAEPAMELADEPAAATKLDLDGIERDLADVELALARLDSGDYWTDEVTGAAIPDEHLAEHPTARRLADR